MPGFFQKDDYVQTLIARHAIVIHLLLGMARLSAYCAQLMLQQIRRRLLTVAGASGRASKFVYTYILC